MRLRALDHALDVGRFVAGHDGEPARVASDVRVLLERYVDTGGARRIAALTGKARLGVEFDANGADRVVEHAEALLVVGDAHCPLLHEARSCWRGSSSAATAPSMPRFSMTVYSSSCATISASPTRCPLAMTKRVG